MQGNRATLKTFFLFNLNYRLYKSGLEPFMEVIAKYPCSEAVLYAATRQLWEAYKEHYTELFKDFRAYYTPAYANEALNEIKHAESLPDMQTRGQEAETLRAQLAKQAQLCLTAWQDLKAYIWDAFPDDLLRKQMLETAGALHYRKASKEDWASMQALMQNGKSFLAAHTSELTSDDNMPAGFVKTFNVTADRFEDYLRKLNGALNNASEGRKTKVAANNNLYEKAMRMARDGARRANDNEEVRKFFIFSKVVDRLEEESYAEAEPKAHLN